MKKKEYLIKELETLKKQQGDLTLRSTTHHFLPPPCTRQLALKRLTYFQESC